MRLTGLAVWLVFSWDDFGRADRVGEGRFHRPISSTMSRRNAGIAGRASIRERSDLLSCVRPR